jgi:hypothetical protein
MVKVYLALTVIFILVSGWSHAEVQINRKTTVTFASSEEGKRILMTRDDFIQRLSPFDRAARMKTDKDVSEAVFLEFIGNNVRTWTETEKQKVDSAFRGIQTRLGELSFPERIYIIKTTGNEEGGAAYTRGNAVVIPEAKLAADTVAIQRIICHELFHILSRGNPALQERLYETIGFTKCNEIEFPAMLKSRKITNPDAPKNDHYIRVQVDGKESCVVPILFASTEKYDVSKGGRFFDYLQFQFLVVEPRGEEAVAIPLNDGLSPRLVDARKVSGFMEQVGKNTRYIIHPEEILADNFVLLILEERNVPSPDIINKIRMVLIHYKNKCIDMNT